MNQQNFSPEQIEQGDRKNSEKSEDSNAKDFMLTQGQRSYIQHHLPQYFSLVSCNNQYSRLNNNSKTLLEESLTFIDRKKGRPEGSCRKKIKKHLNDRKSERIASSKWLKSNQNEERIGQQFSLESFQHFPNQSATQQMVRIDTMPIFKQLQASKPCRQELMKQIKESEVAIFDSNPRIIFSSAAEEKVIIQSCERVEEKIQINKQKQDDSRSNLMVQERKQHEQQDLNGRSLIKQENSVSKTKKLRKVNTKTKQSQNGIKQASQIHPQVIKTTSCLQQEVVTASKQIIKIGNSILKKLKNHKNILPFTQPVDEQRDGAPNYYKEIANPIDLKTIEFKLNSAIYKAADDFHSDIRLMWANSKLYNRNNAFMRDVTSKLQGFYLGLLAKASSKESHKNIFFQK